MFRLLHPRGVVKVCCGRSVLFYSTHADIHDILSTHLGINHDAIEDVIKSQNEIFNIPRRNLIWNCKMLGKLNVDIQQLDYLTMCLRYPPNVMTNRIRLLQEMGVDNIRLIYICRFHITMQKSLNTFKRLHDMPSEFDILQSIFSHVGLEPQTMANLPNTIGKEQTCQFYKACMEYYKSYHLKLYYKPLIETKRMYQSFRQITEILEILQNTFGFSMEYLSKHSRLLNLCPEGVNNFLTELQDIRVGDMDVLTIAKKYPLILWNNAGDIKDVIALIKELNMEEGVATFPRIMCLKKDIFLERYQNIKDDPILCLWSKHPRLLYLMYYLKSVKSRMARLEVLDRLKNVNIHTLLSAKQFFLRYLEGNISHLATKKFLRYVICKELGEDKDYVIPYIMRHPHWKQLSLTAAEKMILCLKENYSTEEICKNIHIILYPQHVVDEMLKYVYGEYTPEKGYNLTPGQYLALCLYVLEKENHFNGNSVWHVMYQQEPNSNVNTVKDTKEQGLKSIVDSTTMDDTLVHRVSEIVRTDIC